MLDYAMRKAIGGEEEELGFTLHRRRSRRHEPVILTNTDFADNIATISEEMEQAQNMLRNIEIEGAKVGLRLNAKKTEMLLFNHNVQNVQMDVMSRDSYKAKVVDNFKYLGGWMNSSEKDFEVRKAQRWSACHKLKKIWSSNLSKKFKIRLFITTVESTLLYGSEAWTINKSFEKKLDGCYTKMLRMTPNVTWQDMIANSEFYGDLPLVSSKVTVTRMKIAGHCVRHEEEETSKLTLWQPVHGKRSTGKRKLSYIDTLLNDTGGLHNVGELRAAMIHSYTWSRLTDLRQVGARPK